LKYDKGGKTYGLGAQIQPMTSFCQVCEYMLFFHLIIVQKTVVNVWPKNVFEKPSQHMAGISVPTLNISYSSVAWF